MRRLLLLLLPISALIAEEAIEQPITDTPMTYEELEKWIESKSYVMGKGFPGKLYITGEVRTEMQKQSEVINNIKQRGGGGAVSGAPTYNYDVELNLMLNYRSERSWANVKLEFDNNAGTFNGTCGKICLERAFFGVRMYDSGSSVGAIEFGRRGLSYTFDSQVEFGSIMDGILLKFSVAFGFAGDFYIYGGPFLVNECKDQYAYIGELGLLNICNSGVYLKYSLVDWDTKSYSNPIEALLFRFINSQWLLGYKFVPPYLNKVVTLFGAFLMNHAAKPLTITNDQKANIAWYTGFYIGTAQAQGDWSLSVVYQYVEALSIPLFDQNGIGTGNSAQSQFFNATTAAEAIGGTNYKGISIDLLYLFTDSITLQNSYSQAIRAQTDIGKPFRYKQYELELIYAF
jgi:hypothetical protein